MIAAGQTCQNNGIRFAIWLSGIISAVIIQIIIRSYVTRADSINARINEFCNAIRSLSEASHEYWCLGPQDAGLPKAEANLSAANHMVNCLAGTIIDRKPKFKKNLENLVFDLSNDATGSQFQVSGRPADVHRYKVVQARAINLLSEMRRYQQGFWVRTFG